MATRSADRRLWSSHWNWRKRRNWWKFLSLRSSWHSDILRMGDTTSCFALVRIPTVIKNSNSSSSNNTKTKTNSNTNNNSNNNNRSAGIGTGTGTANRRGSGTFVASPVCEALQ